MIRPSDIHSLTDFTRNAKAYVEEIKRNRRPMAITVNGEAELIVMDVATYQEMDDSIDRRALLAELRAYERNPGQALEEESAFQEVRQRVGL